MGQPMFRVFKRETIQKTLSLMVLLLFHYEPIPNQTGQMQMHKSPLLFLRLNNSVRISVQTNMVWLITPSHPSTDSFKGTVWAGGGVSLCITCSRFYQKSSVFLLPLHLNLQSYMWKAHSVSSAYLRSPSEPPISLEGLLSCWARNLSPDMMKGNTKKNA